MRKLNYEDLRLMPLADVIAEASMYGADELLETKLRGIPSDGRGIYALYDGLGEILYVGKSENVRKRLRNHLNCHEKITARYAKDVQNVRVFYVDEEVKRQNLYAVEKWFITHLAPKHNVV
ncbi:GIY-YIG nuclease family protein [Peribacillus butanolivorans]|uniref:GIY-YIG domain-containing protein n=1 Tax=Peribacillus butanolivorans TaxID=421767 RepID=A0ABM6XML3_9BACI|nr:GIY-YIG nuclease family protein [Peribacillus butanolivorans]AXN39800.1 hypothetical protein DTO10_16490 [Peribacillus butanolivorans]